MVLICADIWHLLVLIHHPAKLDDVPAKLGYYTDATGAT